LTEYAVIYEKAADGGWGAYTPDIPGVVSAGDTREETERNMKEAISLHLSELRRLGVSPPEPRNSVGTVTV
jgi:predicted RNase H-like HicB family nuclease